MTSGSPVPFGSSLRSEWLLDPAVTYLNHGTVGAPPRLVLDHQLEWVDRIERQPAKFVLRELVAGFGPNPSGANRMREVAAVVADFVGADADGVVWVDNITTGANAVLRGYPLGPGDQIVCTALGYGGVTKTAQYAARRAGADFFELPMPLPGAPVADFVAAVADGLAALPPAGERILVIDHLTSGSALVLPVAEIAEVAHAAGAKVFVDGAHVPGNVALDIAALGVEWYSANLHKWAWAPRSVGFLWTAPELREVTKPTVTSWGFDLGYTAEFDLAGTRDTTAWLSVPFALDLLRGYGLDAVYAYNHELAWWAGQYLSDRWGVPFTTPEEMIGAMVLVHLPESLGTDDAAAQAVFDALQEAGFELPVFGPGPNGPTLSARVCAQIYVDRADIERLADTVLELAHPTLVS